MSLPLTIILAQPGLPGSGALTTIAIGMFLLPTVVLVSAIALLLFIFRRGYFNKLHIVNLLLILLAAVFFFTLIPQRDDGKHMWWTYLPIVLVALSFIASLLHFFFRYKARRDANTGKTLLFILLLSPHLAHADPWGSKELGNLVLLAISSMANIGLFIICLVFFVFYPYHKQSTSFRGVYCFCCYLLLILLVIHFAFFFRTLISSAGVAGALMAWFAITQIKRMKRLETTE